jgi:5-methylcytosine-specific restriction endonuclease McrA
MTHAAHAERSSRSLLTMPCLKLNADYRPLATYPLSLTTVRKAIEGLVKETMDVVEEWGGVFRSPSASYPVPKVVVLRTYAPIYSEPKFCRRSILLRDRFRCQYCGQRFESHELTYDHVIPRAAGGKTEWDNIVSSCLKCNSLKADQLPNYSGRRGARGSLRPLKAPRRPSTAELLRAGLEFLPTDLREDFGSFLYWNAELQA